ncbi:trypsin-like peptidase domain-containing protein [Rhizobium leguminosarum]|uniref:trypsin-like peptidase domain-containing protein n=1 Tax=Rhizobium leguminosarum TaxID=384 RepID=UPI001C985BE0|nr:trypsin-like peptidase domain-containing protein [Rhizobium leguminosarum]MBY5482244.1 trypsin-like peptidase domain-containing protein [Rhizobium leguminosarum]
MSEGPVVGCADSKVAIVDQFPFPVQELRAQELVRVMAGFYRTEREAVPFVAPFGIDPVEIIPGLTPLNMWFELLGKLAILGRVRAAVEATRDQFPNNPRASFLDSLLCTGTAPVSAEPVEKDDPGFDDGISAPEALLFHDDLTIPTGRVPALILTLNKMVELAPAICLLRVENALGSFFGTGFRIGGDQVLTNHHVLFPKGEKATRVQADFGFDIDASGASLGVISLGGVANSIVGEKDDDWAVVSVQDMNDGWPVLSLDDLQTPAIGDAAFILQHPGGQQRRLGFVRNTISEVADGTIKYITDTQPGSSGAPVLDHAGRLVGLHHAGGRSVEVAGMPPVSKNEGIRISRVVERLKANGLI